MQADWHRLWLSTLAHPNATEPPRVSTYTHCQSALRTATQHAVQAERARLRQQLKDQADREAARRQAQQESRQGGSLWQRLMQQLGQQGQPDEEPSVEQRAIQTATAREKKLTEALGPVPRAPSAPTGAGYGLLGLDGCRVGCA